jgi:hypothetical protein
MRLAVERREADREAERVRREEMLAAIADRKRREDEALAWQREHAGPYGDGTLPRARNGYRPLTRTQNAALDAEFSGALKNIFCLANSRPSSNHRSPGQRAVKLSRSESTSRIVSVGASRP